MTYTLGDDGELNQDAPVNPEMDDPFADLGPSLSLRPPEIIPSDGSIDGCAKFVILVQVVSICGTLCMICSVINAIFR